MVVREVGAQGPLEMAVAVDDDMFEALKPDRADHALTLGFRQGERVFGGGRTG